MRHRCISLALLSLGAFFTCVAGVACGAVPPLDVQQSHVFHEDLSPADIAAESVVSGNPKARVKLISQTDDKEVTAVLWDCTAGSFKWHFRSGELVHILDGSVKVESSDHSTRQLKVGDVAYFPAGTDSIWHVEKYVKKLAIIRSNRESVVRRAQKKLNRLFANL